MAAFSVYNYAIPTQREACLADAMRGRTNQASTAVGHGREQDKLTLAEARARHNIVHFAKNEHLLDEARMLKMYRL